MLKGPGVDSVVADAAQRDSIESGLSRRERQVLAGLCAGRTEKQVAVALGLSAHAVHFTSARFIDSSTCAAEPSC